MEQTLQTKKVTKIMQQIYCKHVKMSELFNCR